MKYALVVCVLFAFLAIWTPVANRIASRSVPQASEANFCTLPELECQPHAWTLQLAHKSVHTGTGTLAPALIIIAYFPGSEAEGSLNVIQIEEADRACLAFHPASACLKDSRNTSTLPPAVMAWLHANTHFLVGRLAIYCTTSCTAISHLRLSPV